MSSSPLYEHLGGFDHILALCRRWHALCLADRVAAHPFEHQLHPQHDERLAAYLSEAFGGPRLYTAGCADESHVQRLHACNGLHVELDEACLRLFDQAVEEMRVPAEAKRQTKAYFRRAAEEMRRFCGEGAVVPDDLPFNKA